MVRRSVPLSVFTVLTLTAALMMGCGGDESQEAAPARPTTSTVTESSETPSTPQPPPEVQLTWLPGGGLALENVGSAPVSLAREVTVQAGEGAARSLQLGLDCAPPGDAVCVPLIPGAAIAFGQWPDSHDACRCPPCVAALGSSEFSVRTCDGAQTVSRTPPER